MHEERKECGRVLPQIRGSRLDLQMNSKKSGSGDNKSYHLLSSLLV